MINLAGRKDADLYIRDELTRCGIKVFEVERTNSEVPYTLEGRLGDLKFTRAWYYWVVSGRVPVDVAHKLYDNFVGKKDIRVGGHCGCPSPDEYGTDWYDDQGRKIIPQKQLDDGDELASKSPFFAEHWEKDKVNRVSDKDAVGRHGFVETYHIDSELGLYIFVQTLKAEGLVNV